MFGDLDLVDVRGAPPSSERRGVSDVSVITLIIGESIRGLTDAHPELWLESRGGRGTEGPVTQRPSGIEQPVQGFLQALHRRTPGSEFLIGVGHCAGQDVEIVVERLEFPAGHHQFVLTDLQFAGSLASDPVPLPTGLAAELAGSPGPGPRRHHAAAPPAPGVPFSHSVFG